METEFYTFKGYYDNGRTITTPEATIRIKGHKVIEGTEGSTYDYRNKDIAGFLKEDGKTTTLAF